MDSRLRENDELDGGTGARRWECGLLLRWGESRINPEMLLVGDKPRRYGIPPPLDSGPVSGYGACFRPPE